MAEKTEKGSDRGFLARTASITTKRAKRAQEKVMQKLGKANETKDLTFDEFVTNFNKQQGAAQRLHKELKNYYTCIKAMLVASDAFGDAVREVYEPDWPGRDKLIMHLEELHVQWHELQEKLYEEVIVPLTAYQSQFPDIKARINKRGRKLVDYDRYRHNLEALRAKGKTGDPKKLTQAEEEYNEAKSVYTKLHAELYEELPALFDSRIGYYVSSFQSIFTAEGVFHREAAKLYSVLGGAVFQGKKTFRKTKTHMNDLMDGLIQDMSTGTYTTKRAYPVTSENQISDSDDTDAQTTSSHPESVETVVCNDEVVTIDSGEVTVVVDGDDEVSNPVTHSDNEENETVAGGEAPEKPKPVPVVQPPPPQVDGTVKVPTEKPQLPPLPANRQQPQAVSAEKVSPSEEAAPSTETDVTLPQTEAARQEVVTSEIPGVLYKVRAAHKYVAEDDDELSFEKGEIISVVEYDDPEEQDEGWLMGILDLSGIKGVFPANFTQRI